MLQHPLLRVFGLSALALLASACLLFLLEGQLGSYLRSPAVVALWAAVAGTLILVLGKLRGVFLRQALIGVLVLPWLIMDGLWQAELAGLLELSQEKFEGRSAHERHLADAEGGLYLYITKAREPLSQLQGGRLFIGYETPAYAASANRAAYYLLPRAAIVAGSELPWQYMRGGDVVLWLGNPRNSERQFESVPRCGESRCRVETLLPPYLIGEASLQHPLYAQFYRLLSVSDAGQGSANE